MDLLDMLGFWRRLWESEHHDLFWMFNINNR